MPRRTAKSPFHGAFSMLHDAIIKKGFVTETGEVSLPYGWDAQDDVVSVSYTKKELPDSLLQTKCILMGETMIINVLHKTVVKTLDIEIGNYVIDFRDHSYEVKNIQPFERKVYEDALYPLIPSLKPPKHTATPTRVQQPERVDPLRDERLPGRAPQPINPMPFPFAVGGDDLNPLGRGRGRWDGPGGGGMIMDPMRAMRGGVGRLPGPRFDPVGPGGFGPDNDELMPPGRPGMPDMDDMFM
eukprot:sb/3469011/